MGFEITRFEGSKHFFVMILSSSQLTQLTSRYRPHCVSIGEVDEELICPICSSVLEGEKYSPRILLWLLMQFPILVFRTTASDFVRARILHGLHPGVAEPPADLSRRPPAHHHNQPALGAENLA